MRNDNYPDDIREYDDDPRSPFYDSRADDAKEDWINNKIEELLADPEWINEATGEFSTEQLAKIGKFVSEYGPANDYQMRLGKLVAVVIFEQASMVALTEFELF